MQSAKGDGHLEGNGEVLQDKDEHVPPHQGRPHGSPAGDAGPQRKNEETRSLL